MKIVYMGPSPKVNVGGYDTPHIKGEVRNYPDAVGQELIGSKKQSFVQGDSKDDAASDASSKASDSGKESAKTGKKGKR